MAVCFDTAHLLAAGYDLSSAAGVRGVLQEAQEVLGLERVRAWHLNDSKAPRGARVDRHDHIGHGYVAKEALAVILRHARFRNVPKVIETPKGTNEGGRVVGRAEPGEAAAAGGRVMDTCNRVFAPRT